MKQLLTLTAIVIAGSAVAQGTVIYAPTKLIADQGITVKGWGSGLLTETDETAYEGAHSLRISSRNYFQGGIITFTNGINLSQDFSNDANLLRITYKTVDSGTGAGGPGTGPGRPNPGTGGPGKGGGGGNGAGFAPGQGGLGQGGLGQGGPGQGGPGFPPGGGFPGQGFPGQGGMNGQAAASSLDFLRVIVSTTDGKKSEAYIPTESAIAGDRGWKSVAVPLKAISGFERTNKIVKSIAIAPDQTNTFFIGELRIVEDTTPIRGQVTPAMLNLGVNQEVRLSAFGLGGASILKYEWDFDDADGIQVDAEGRSLLRRFRKEGEYTITLTISDFYGLKKPYVTTIKAKVNP